MSGLPATTARARRSPSPCWEEGGQPPVRTAGRVMAELVKGQGCWEPSFCTLHGMLLLWKTEVHCP